MDGLSQPRLAGLPGRRRRTGGRDRRVRARLPQRVRPAHRASPARPPRPTRQRILPRDPAGTGAADLGRDGSYLVVRQLRQDVEGFRTFLRERTRTRRTGSEDLPAQERLAAKMVGRWPQRRAAGAGPGRRRPGHRRPPTSATTPKTRRAWPARSARTSGGPTRGTRWRRARAASGRCEVNRRHRLLRRGRNYSVDSDDRADERGLHFLCLVANLARQYEFVQHRWINDPVFNGLHDDADPLVGPARHARAHLRRAGRARVRRRHRGLPEFVRVRGGAYFFLPGVGRAALPGPSYLPVPTRRADEHPAELARDAWRWPSTTAAGGTAGRRRSRSR